MIWQKPFLILKNCALNKLSIEGAFAAPPFLTLNRKRRLGHDPTNLECFKFMLGRAPTYGCY